MAMNSQQEAQIARARQAITDKQAQLAKANLARLNGDQSPAAAVAAPVALSDEPRQAETEPAAAAEPVAAGPSVEQLQEELRVLQERFKWAEGHLKAETQRHQQEAARLQQEAREQAALAETERRERLRLQQESERSRPITDADLLKYLPQAEIDRMGTDAAKAWVSAQRTIASEITNSAVESRSQDADRRISDIQTSALEARKQVFWDRVNEKVPDFNLINDSAEFKQWLNSKDDVTGKTLRDLGNDSIGQLDHRRVIALVERYKATLPKEAPPATPNKGMIPVGRGKGDVRVDLPQKPVVTLEEISEMERLGRTGAFRTPEGRKKLAELKQRIADARGGQRR